MPLSGLYRDEDGEKVFLPVKNVSGDTISLGDAVALAVTGNSVDGTSAVKADSSTAANLPGFLGIAERDIADTAVGLVQSVGFADSVLLSNVGTSLTITQGDPLVPGALAGGLFSAAPTYANSGLRYVLAAETATVSAGTNYIKGFLRCR